MPSRKIFSDTAFMKEMKPDRVTVQEGATNKQEWKTGWSPKWEDGKKFKGWAFSRPSYANRNAEEAT